LFDQRNLTQQVKFLLIVNNDPIFRYFAREQEQARINAIKLLAKTALRYSQPYNHLYNYK